MALPKTSFQFMGIFDEIAHLLNSWVYVYFSSIPEYKDMIRNSSLCIACLFQWLGCWYLQIMKIDIVSLFYALHVLIGLLVQVESNMAYTIVASLSLWWAHVQELSKWKICIIISNQQYIFMINWLFRSR